MKSGKILVVLAIFLLVSIGFSSAQAYTAGLYEDVIAFGDSLSDSGNVIVAPLSNGPVWVEYLADHFEANLYNFSQAGAVTGPTVIPPTFPVVNILDQVNTFVDLTKTFPTLFPASSPQTLYTYWGGPNDLFDLFENQDPSQAPFVITQAVSNTAEALTSMAAVGAQNILILNVPDLGLTPAAISGDPGDAAGATLVSSAYNNALTNMLNDFSSNYAGNLFVFDVFTLFQEVVADPALYGFDNVSDPIPSDPGSDVYLFWDEVHPTTDGHRVVAEQTIGTVVSVPGAVWLLGSALLLLTGIRRKRR